MARQIFRKGTNQRSKKGIIHTVVVRIGGIKYAIQSGVETKVPSSKEVKKEK